MMFCLPIHTLSPFHQRFVYIDLPEYLADTIFIQNKIHVKFEKEWKKPDNPYIIILCKIKKKDKEKFEKSLKELERKMLLMGHSDYQEMCKNIETMFPQK